MKYTIQLLILLTVLLTGCGSADSVAGNGTETGNPRIIGIASEKSGKPVVNGKVTICKSNYSPFSKDLLYSTTTNSSGQFELEVHDTGSYSIVLFSPDSSTGITTSCRLTRDSVVQLNSITLEETKTVIIRRKAVVNSQSFYLEGSSFTFRFPEGNDSTALSHIPVGSYRLIDSLTGISAVETAFTSSDPAIVTVTLKPTILVIAPFEWDSSTNSVSQLIRCYDSSTCQIVISDSRESEKLLTSNMNFSGIVILYGAEQNVELVQLLDTISLPILVSSAGWYSRLHMTADTGIGMESSNTFLIDGENHGIHPIISSLELTTIASLAVVKSPVLLSWGKPNIAIADILAYGISDQSRKFIFSYETGAEMFTKNAPARRVGLPFGNWELTETGESIYRDAIGWFCLQ